jgi:hypothetical protein
LFPYSWGGAYFDALLTWTNVHFVGVSDAGFTSKRIHEPSVIAVTAWRMSSNARASCQQFSSVPAELRARHDRFEYEVVA